jgi:hypothetical protein
MFELRLQVEALLFAMGDGLDIELGAVPDAIALVRRSISWVSLRDASSDIPAFGL